MAVPVVDAVVLLVYMAGVILLGLWLGRGQKTTKAYTVGDRNLPWIAVLFSIVATETSTVTFLSIPGIAYGGTHTWLQLPFGFALGRVLVAWLLLPRYFEGELVTAYEVLHRRFGGRVKQLASVIFLCTRTLADGLRLFLSAIVLQKVAGIDLTTAILATGIVTILYTFYGGIRAVIWTDLIQFFVYIAGAGIAFWILLQGIHGGLRTILAQTDKLQVFDFRFDLTVPTTFWAGLIGGAFISLGTHGADHMIVQRYLCARSQRDARKALLVSGVVVVAQFAFFLLIGTALWCYYQQQPPTTPFQRDDEVFATFILDHMPTGILGIVLGAIFAAAMSTLSSSLNSCATSAVHDLWVPLCRPDATDREQLRQTRILTVVFGLLQITIGIAGQQMQASVVDSVIKIAAFTMGIVLGVYFLALFTKAGARAVLLAMLTSTVVTAAVFFGEVVAGTWLALVGSLTTLLAGFIYSRLLPETCSTSGEG